MSRINVWAGFPGIGKSFLSNEIGAHDSDSSTFSRSPGFPENYIEHIKSLEGYVFCSTHEVVRQALYDAKIPFGVVVPDIRLKDEYMQRYEDRGSPESLIGVILDNWENWILEIESDIRPTTKIKLTSGQYLKDVYPLIQVVSE